MESNNVTYQTAELGKVDLGGGGTIAYIMALYGMNVIDCGVAVLSMHVHGRLHPRRIFTKQTMLCGIFKCS